MRSCFRSVRWLPLLLAAFWLAACGANSKLRLDRPEDQFGVVSVERNGVIIGARAVVEAGGRFGPDLPFVLRLPAAWDGRLLILLPAESGEDPDLETLATAQVAAGAAQARLAYTGRLDMPDVLAAFIRFSGDQLRAEYGRVADRVYLIGSSEGAWQALRMAERDDLIIDGVVAISPWNPADALRDVPPILQAMDQLSRVTAELEADSLATLNAAELAVVQSLWTQGLPSGSEVQWPAARPVWEAALRSALARLDPEYLDGGAALAAYDFSGRPRSVRNQATAITPAGEIEVRVVWLQGAQDVFSVPRRSEQYAVRVGEADRAAGLARYVFPGQDHALSAPDQAAGARAALLRRAWELLVGWVESPADVSPGNILGVSPPPIPARAGGS